MPYPGEKPAARADLATLYEQWGVYREEAPVATKTVAARALSVGVDRDRAPGLLFEGLSGSWIAQHLVYFIKMQLFLNDHFAGIFLQQD